MSFGIGWFAWKSPAAQKEAHVKFYEIVAEEIGQGRIDRTLWTRAVGNSRGEEQVAKSLYIQYRTLGLQEEYLLDCKRRQAAALQAKQAEDKKRSDEAARGCGIALLVIFGGIAVRILLGLILDTISAHNRRIEPAPSPPSENAPVQATLMLAEPAAPPTLAERQTALAKTLAELDEEYHRLIIRRDHIEPGNLQQLTAYNRYAAEYTRRVEEAKGEQEQLNRVTPLRP